MNMFKAMETPALQEFQAQLARKYEEIQAKNLKLDMSRGKPCPEQLDLSAAMLTCLGPDDYKSANGTDCRNYGGIEGIAEARELFSSLLDVKPSEILIGGNSSLTLMHDVITGAMLHTLPGGTEPWCKLPKVKFLCPSPGYDRHFAICESLGMELIIVDYKEDGPDMDQVEALVAADDAIKGIWCVPKYSNPTGITYSDDVVKRLASMPAKAADFRIMWDNAYTIHHLTDEPDTVADILAACRAAGNPDRVLEFSSTSKVTFPGAGIAVVAGSENNIAWLKKRISIQTVGPDKLNQLRHVRFFQNKENIAEHMRKHAAVIKPKFDIVLETLQQHLGGKGIASWSNPNGGYFISLDTLPGCAKKVAAKAAAAGVVLTAAGATYPCNQDPEDKNIRIAPTLPPVAELKTAMELLSLCIELVSAEAELTARKA